MNVIPPADIPLNSEGCTLIDVRTPPEFEEFHICGATSIPLDELNPEELAKQIGGKEVSVYLLCRSGGRATKAGEILEKSGFSKVFVVAGGTLACRETGLKVITGVRKRFSLERQVRIASGSLTLLGVIMGTFVSPIAYIIPAFVGAGLIFAGVTDWCGLGLLIARAPWNR